MRRIAVIPARAGSKRLPRKNMIDFLGKPIIAYTIEAALEANRFDRVVVSTESEELADIALTFGAEVDHRDPALATDEARVKDVCVGLVENELKANRTYDILSVLYATAPLRQAKDVQGVVDLIEPDTCNHALAVTHFNVPPHQALAIDDAGTMEPMFPTLLRNRASELPTLVADNGSTYAVVMNTFMENPGFYGPGMRGYTMSALRSVDIDLPEDLELAKLFARRLEDEC